MRDGRPSGFGFVEFDSEDAAQKALREMDQKELDGKTIRVEQATRRRRGGGGDRGDRGHHLCPDADAPPPPPCEGGDGVRAKSRGDEAQLFSPPSMTAAGSILGDGALIPASRAPPPSP